jgi:hypothetical protein
VPVLLHFQFGRYNTSFERFHTILEKFPKVNFIGHAQTWWANIDKNHQQAVLYPKTPVTPGGITDRLLSDYPNIFGDTSAGSGLNSFTRDEDHARDLLLVFGVLVHPDAGSDLVETGGHRGDLTTVPQQHPGVLQGLDVAIDGHRRDAGQFDQFVDRGRAILDHPFGDRHAPLAQCAGRTPATAFHCHVTTFVRK